MPPAAPTAPAADRTPVKNDDARKVTFYLPEDLWREFNARMAYAGQTSTSRFLIDSLGLRTPSPTNK